MQLRIIENACKQPQDELSEFKSSVRLLVGMTIDNSLMSSIRLCAHACGNENNSIMCSKTFPPSQWRSFRIYKKSMRSLISLDWGCDRHDDDCRWWWRRASFVFHRPRISTTTFLIDSISTDDAMHRVASFTLGSLHRGPSLDLDGTHLDSTVAWQFIIIIRHRWSRRSRQSRQPHQPRRDKSRSTRTHINVSFVRLYRFVIAPLNPIDVFTWQTLHHSFNYTSTGRRSQT